MNSVQWIKYIIYASTPVITIHCASKAPAWWCKIGSHTLSGEVATHISYRHTPYTPVNGMKLSHATQPMDTVHVSHYLRRTPKRICCLLFGGARSLTQIIGEHNGSTAWVYFLWWCWSSKCLDVVNIAAPTPHNWIHASFSLYSLYTAWRRMLVLDRLT